MRRRTYLMTVFCLCSVLCGSAFAEKKSDAKPAGEEVEMFSAIGSGAIEVKMIPQDSKGGNLVIKNKSDKPLTIKLPEAFAGVPVAAQFGGGGGQFGGGGGQFGGGGGNQGIGGGFGGGQQGGGGGQFGGGGGGGFFNVPAGKEGKLKFVAVCLEHGKKDPTPNVAYEIKPLESFTTNPDVIELVKMFGRGEIDARLQASVQAAVWHHANGLSWEELARKIGVKHLDGSTEPYFQSAQLEQALRMSKEAERRAEDQKSKSSSKANSLSNR